MGVGGATAPCAALPARSFPALAFAAPPGRDDVADVRDVGEILGGTMEESAADVAGGIGPRLERALPRESGGLGTVRNGRDAGPGAADHGLLRTLSRKSRRFAAGHLGGAAEPGLLGR